MFLMLLRHTKSSWSEPGMSDHDRRLNERGKRSAILMADHIAKECPRPDAIICSSAVRTQETLEPIMAALGEQAPMPNLTRAIYEAPSAAYLAEIASVPAGQSVLVVGHNPTTESLAIALSGRDPNLLSSLATGYPTGGLTLLEFDDGDWSAALANVHTSSSTGVGRFISFTAPKLLHGQQAYLA